MASKSISVAFPKVVDGENLWQDVSDEPAVGNLIQRASQEAGGWTLAHQPDGVLLRFTQRHNLHVVTRPSCFVSRRWGILLNIISIHGRRQHYYIYKRRQWQRQLSEFLGSLLDPSMAALFDCTPAGDFSVPALEGTALH